MAKRGNIEQWRELGELTKETYLKVVHLCVMADKIMPGKDWRDAGKSQMALSHFKSHAEDVMFRQLGREGGATIDIFYGGEDGGYLPK